MAIEVRRMKMSSSRGEPFAVLWPAEAPIYGRFDCGMDLVLTAADPASARPVRSSEVF